MTSKRAGNSTFATKPYIFISDHAMAMTLAKAVAEAGGQRRFAEQHGISQSRVSRTLTGKERPSAAMLAAIGLRRATDAYLTTP